MKIDNLAEELADKILRGTIIGNLWWEEKYGGGYIATMDYEEKDLLDPRLVVEVERDFSVNVRIEKRPYLSSDRIPVHRFEDEIFGSMLIEQIKISMEKSPAHPKILERVTKIISLIGGKVLM